ncbi:MULTISPECIES: alpha/beta fold hydrolase [Pseudonocardiaceae]|uniref:Uncharacterized protein n=1 Tax=Prauserella muralis TaxID=588067 RepID=A0A2V4AFP2_9PSEU|nr:MULTISPECIES: alpha/beta hydrolase [Pseudonocardiaceae]OLZ51821.1 hypothetical protein BS330_24505 [Amycolatopsis keratiniphila subsp. nogabecina]PXY16953.1 hypothetical protein BAY60_35130 [Prauserella muralis]TWE15011.1 pimeloyl-ACP methyl ester carboxylesterase [Prauserella muralis]SDU62708.1 Pimeloyl-ACP methyl ester carboxylesterase [Amycolatopsis keratiniphila]
MTTGPTTVHYQCEGITLAGDHWTPDTSTHPRGTAILLHGVGQTRKSWQRTAARLAADGWSALTLDARGHGDSDWACPDGYTLEHLVDDLTHIGRTCEDRPVLVGASMGGLTALVAQAHHDLGRALVMVDIAPQMNTTGAERILRFMGQHREGFATLDDAAAALADYNPHRTTPGSTRGLRKNLRKHRDGRWYWHWDPQLLQFMADPAAFTATLRQIDDAAHQITAPTLLIRGELSDVIDQGSVEHLLDRIPTASSITIANTGHMIVGDDNDFFTTALLDYLNDLPAIPDM